MKTITPDANNFGRFFKHDQFPPIDNEAKEYNLSDYVLIDGDGKRTKFSVGYYDFDMKKWILCDENIEFNQEDIVWTLLPLDKYDSQNYEN